MSVEKGLWSQSIEMIRKKGMLHWFRQGSGYVDTLAGFPFARLNYMWCRIVNRPYFGRYCTAGQCTQGRSHYMRRLAASRMAEMSGPFMMLEVGSWAGSSAIIWAQTIRDYHAGKGLVVCVDMWRQYGSIDRNSSRVHRSMYTALKKDRILQLFHHNVRASGYGDMILSLRGSSVQCLPILREKAFDLVYVDADHAYSSAIRDIEAAAKLLKPGGILCGDDLELQFSRVDGQHTIESRESDWTVDAQSGVVYHPGVTSAVWDYFSSEVGCWDGFWGMQKTEDGWVRPVLASES